MTAKRHSITTGRLAPMAAAQGKPDRVIVVTLDGMRWQEIFGGADRGLITGTDGGVADTAFSLRRF